jgi:hypothetical protein
MRSRMTIAAMMAGIGLIDVAFAALRTASPLWASALFSLAAFATLAAAIAALATRGSTRVAWGGFAVARGGYLYLAFSFAAGESDLSAPPLLTSAIFGRTIRAIAPRDQIRGLSRAMIPSLTNEPNLYPDTAESDDPLGDVLAPPPPVAPPTTPGGPWTTTPVYQSPPVVAVYHFRIGHSLAAIVAGLAGAAWASWLSRRSEINSGPKAT